MRASAKLLNFEDCPGITWTHAFCICSKCIWALTRWILRNLPLLLLPPSLVSVCAWYMYMCYMCVSVSVVQGKGGPASRHPAAGNMMGTGGMQPQIKQEIVDPTFEDIECKSL